MGNFFREFSTAWDFLQHFMLNFIATFYVRFAHNAMYYMVNFYNWENHFMHYFFTTCLLAFTFVFCCIPKQRAAMTDILPVALSQVVVTVCTAVIHRRDHYEAVHMYRWADAVFTLAFLYLGRRFLDKKHVPTGRRQLIVIVIAIAGSFSWFEWWIKDYDQLSLYLLTPLIGIFNAIHFILILRKQDKLKLDSDTFTFYVVGLTTLFLWPLCYYNSEHTFNRQMLTVSQTWVFIDSVLFMLTIVFMTSMTYTKYWLMQHAAPDGYLVYRHWKFTLGGIGMWLLEPEKAEILFINVTAKVVVFLGTLLYLWKCFTEYKFRQRISAAS